MDTSTPANPISAYIFFKGCFALPRLSALRGVLPSSPLVWTGPSAAVTGGTGGGVASPQKSSELNKPPFHTHKDFISLHSACAHRRLQKTFFFQAEKKKERRGSRYPSGSGRVQISLSSRLTRLLFIPVSPPFPLPSGLCERLHAGGFVAHRSGPMAPGLCSLPSAAGSCCNVHCLHVGPRLWFHSEVP